MTANINALKQTQSVEILIIGFGLSTIPLIRELEKSGKSYAIISAGCDIWEALEKANRLDFDLVSSKNTSMYSFELINREIGDNYPTAREFAEFLKKYKQQYQSKVINDYVIKIENFEDYSLAYTESGLVFKTNFLVIATSFKRKIRDSILEYDFQSKKDKTIVFTTCGDSANLMMAKLIPNNNKIILVTNGFLCLDKLVVGKNNKYVVADQIEVPNILHLSSLLYRIYVWGATEQAHTFPKIAKYLLPDLMFSKHPITKRNTEILPQFDIMKDMRGFFRSRPFKNGLIFLKYWPIDSYQQIFDNENLEESIRSGFILNDIAFYIEKGLVELYSKEQTTIDRENKTIYSNGKILQYDDIIEGDAEVPRLPSIIIKRSGLDHEYQYAYRDTYMGVIPKELSNVFFIGFTRPSTGGLCNIIEMQSMFVHKLLTNDMFRKDIYTNLDLKIKKYNKKCYASDFKQQNDHLVVHGFYNEDIARLMGINLRLRECRSLKDIIIYYIFPNNAFKYRQKGDYKVDNVKELVNKMYEHNKSIFMQQIKYLYGFAINAIILAVPLTIMYFQQTFKLSFTLYILLAVASVINPFTPYVVYNTGNINVTITVLTVGLALTCVFINPWFAIGAFCTAGCLSYIYRKLGYVRILFNDLSIKRKQIYKDFFERYCRVFKKIYFQSNDNKTIAPEKQTDNVNQEETIA